MVEWRSAETVKLLKSKKKKYLDTRRSKDERRDFLKACLDEVQEYELPENATPEQKKTLEKVSHLVTRPERFWLI